jgi:sugar transferase (PEP-CTERM/EpsH1 system associated)
MAPERTRILYLNHCMAMGGIENMIVDFTRLLPRGEFEPHVGVFEGGGSLEAVLGEERVPVHPLHKREGIDPGLIWRLRRLLHRERIRVIHSHNYSAWLYACIAARGLRGMTHVHTEHSGVESFRRRYAAERWLSRFTTAVVAVSKHVHDVMIDEIRIAPRRVRLIYNGVDTTRFAPRAPVREAARRALGIAPDTVVIGIVARLAQVKNHEMLIRAFALLSGEPDSRARLVIVGDGPERAALEQLTQELGIGGRVFFLGERRDTPELLSAFDLYSLTSISEGMNLTLLEAMASGLPVVATGVGGNTEIVREGETGHLVPSGDVESLHQRLRRLALDPGQRAQMGRAGRERVLRDFDQQAMMQHYLSLYRGVDAEAP